VRGVRAEGDIRACVVLPNFIGIGAPKAATSWLHRCLSEHPEVFVARQKEVNILHYDSVHDDLSTYRTHFARAGAAKAIGEISVRYLDSQNAPRRVARYLPGARVFVSLRNPVEQVYSHYWHLRRQNFHQSAGGARALTFEEAMEQLPEVLVRPAEYGRHLQNWLRHVDRAQLLVLFYDDVVADPDSALRMLYSHLGVDATFVPPSLRTRDASVRVGTSPRGPISEKLQSLVYDMLARGAYAQLKRLVGVRLAARLKDGLRAREVMEFMFQTKGYPTMPPEVRRKLMNRFRGQIDVVSRLTGRDLSSWCQSPSDV